jgi:uncharacterized protein YkwD
MLHWILSLLLLFPYSEKVPIAEVERHVHRLINRERAKGKVRLLKLDSELSEIARMHSRDMAERGFFAHVNPEGKSATDRGRDEGFTCRVVEGRYVRSGLGENIYSTSAYRPVLHRPGPLPYYEMRTGEEIAIAAVHGWMESEGHRMNILQKVYRLTGIGVAVSGKDRVLVTQVFC